MSKHLLGFLLLAVSMFVSRGCNSPATIEGHITFAVGMDAPSQVSNIGPDTKPAVRAPKKTQSRRNKKP